MVNQVVNKGYAPDLEEHEVEEIGQDALLIAYALVDPSNRCIVTTETSKPRKIRGNRHIPDVCHDMGVKSYNTFQFIQHLDFRTDWKKDL